MRRQNVFKDGKSSRQNWWKRYPWLRYLFSLFLVYRVIVDTFGEMGFVKYSRMEAHHGALTADIAALKKDNVRLIKEVHALLHSPDTIERIARDKLGLARPGEIVYYYGDP